MSAGRLWSDLSRLGVTLTAAGGRLRVCAPVGVVTPDLRQHLQQNRDELLALAGGADPGNNGAHYRWAIRFADRQVEACFLPEATAEELQAQFPGAVVEPLPDRGPRRSATAAERGELAALVALVYAGDTEDERAEALTLAQADPTSALPCYRAIARAYAAGADVRRVSRQGRQ